MARELGCDIISADSRQVYRDIPVTTAAPTPMQLRSARHHLVGFLPLEAYYSAANFADDARRIISEAGRRGDKDIIVCGGSALYISALLGGLDELPSVSAEVRTRVAGMYADIGLDGLNAYLENLDPEYAARVDRANPRRVMHAVELCLQSGRPLTQLLAESAAPQPEFDYEVTIVNPARQTLFDRINRRVDTMVEQGMEAEARAHLHLRHLNSLNTIGFKEWFAHFDGLLTRDEAIARIAKNTRVYAKKQITMLKKLFPEKSV